MNLHEYQAKDLFARYGIAVPEGRVARDIDEVRAAGAAIARDGATILKAQVHAGGRGKVGGVLRCQDLPTLEQQASALLGSRLVTAQSASDGLPVDRLLVEAPVEIARELYLSLLVERAAGQITVLASTEGGTEIERVAASRPEKILTSRIEPAAGLRPWQSRRLGLFFGLDRTRQQTLAAILDGLYRLFVDCDASLVEINPLVVTAAGELVALDAKVNLDANALYRQPELSAWLDPSQEDPREVSARTLGLSYISLGGNIGCMVNGAGLAMATMDLIALHGGAPANFLDVGGGATAERVAEAFKLILSDSGVVVVLVNIFGGIVRCDLIADGILRAVRDVGVSVPVVVRLEGTNAALGRERLASSGLAIHTAATLADAADAAVSLAAAAAVGANP